MKLSVLVPGIRPQNWKKLYDFVSKATKESFEMIFIGPYPPLDDLPVYNIKYIQDWGSPIRCQQIGLLQAQGDWITWAADDGYYLDNSLDIAFELAKNENYVIMGKHFEGEGNEKLMDTEQYYSFHNYWRTASPFIPKHFVTLCCGIVSRKKLLELGGWDCQFEVCPMSYADLSVRLQKDKSVKFIIQKDPMFICSHMPGISGDHAPIHYAQTEHDEPLFQEIYFSPTSLWRSKIDINNWKKASDKWERRFK